MNEETQKALDKLQTFLQNHQNTTIGDIMKQLNMTHMDVLRLCNIVSDEYKNFARKNALRIMTSTKKDVLAEYFQTQIVDLGFLCQHHIKEIREAMADKLEVASHQMFYNNWLLHRGY